MSTAIALIDKITDPLAWCKEMSGAAERFCGAKSSEEGEAINLICLLEGITYLDFIRRYHLVRGKPTMRYDAMLTHFRRLGGRYRIVERTSENAAIEWVFEGNTYLWSYSWEDAQQSRWPWKDAEDHSKGLKDNWSTPTDRKNMLFARLVSDSLRVICPEVAEGIYTPEETADYVVEAKTSQAGPSAMDLVKQASQQSAPQQADDVQDAEFTPAVAESEPQVEATSDANATVADDPGGITQSQKQRIVELFKLCQIPKDEQDAILERRGVTSLNSLKKEAAQEIIDRLDDYVRANAKN